MSILTGASATKARYDTCAYVDRIAALGNSIDAANQEMIRDWAANVYSRLGPTDFWTFRMAQSVGTGSQAYSFHGKSATLAAGKAWSADGLASNAANQSLVLGAYYDADVTGPCWAMGVYNRGTYSGNVAPMFQFRHDDFANGNTGSYFWLEDATDQKRSLQYSVASHRYALTAGSASTANTWNTFVGGYSSAYDQGSLYQNGSLLAISPSGQAINPTGVIDGRWMAKSSITVSTGTRDDIMSFGMIVTGSIPSQSTIAALHAAYKSTIGSGLALP